MFRDVAILYALTLVVRLATALPLEHPSYMDAAYYVDGALNLYEGRGFSDPFIWNYLDDPAGIPRPSHLYWMPLSSMLAYAGMLAGGPSYGAAQMPFVLLSSLVPCMAYLIAYDVRQARRHAWGAALLTIFSPFYVTHWVTVDNFAPFAVSGALCLWMVGRGTAHGRPVWCALAGLGAGLAHLSRSDGLLLLGIGWLVIAWRAMEERERRRSLVLGGVLFTLAYLVVMGPWFARNWQAIGRPLSTAGTQTMWLTEYDDLYSYGKALNMQTYLAWGWQNIFRSKLDGLWRNLGQVLFAGWMIFMAPFGLLGVWQLRRRIVFRAAWLYLAGLYLAMSLVFTLPGWRGGMVHSMTALLPFFYAAGMEGLDVAVAWAARRRASWHVGQARAVFAAGLVGFAIVLSGVLYGRALGRVASRHPYSVIAEWMAGRIDAEARVVVNDPPLFYYYGRRPCLAIPNGDRETLLQVMDRYSARYLILDQHNLSLADLYRAPREANDLVLRHTFSDWERPVYVFERSD